jgi:hypothetical protein
MTFKRWLPTFLAFPLGGLIAIETVGSLEGPASAAAGGLLAGAIIGAGQWLALRSQGIDGRWAIYTAAAMAAGTALAAAVTGAGTAAGDLVFTGLAAGVAVGAAQSRLLEGGRLVAAAWTTVTAASWSLGWLATWAAGIHVERGFHVFGSSGALLVTVITGLALQRLLAATGETSGSVRLAAAVRV